MCRQWSGKLTLSLPTTARTSCLPGSPRLESSLKFRGGAKTELDRFPTLSKPSTVLILGTRTCPNSPPSASSPFPLSSAFPGALIILRNRLHQRHRPRGSRSHLNRPPSSQPSSLPELVTSTGSGGVSSFFLLAGLDFRLETVFVRAVGPYLEKSVISVHILPGDRL